MLHQERSRAHGGILADEMGMAISVILSNPPAPRNAAQKAEWNRSDESHGIVPNPKQRGKSLVVVPTVAIRQWQTELLRFTKPGSLSVHVYHGGNRSTESSLHTLMKADVVLTSFKIIELEYRRATAGTKVECSICGKKYYPEKLRVHRKYFCGDTAQLTEAQSKTQRKKLKRGSTAEVSHSSESDSEEDEIDKQKRLIKEMRERGETGARAKATTKRTAVAAPSRVTGRKKPLDLQGKKVSGKGCGEAKKASKGKGPRKMKGPPNRERDTDSDYCESSEEVS
ncbi:RAD16, partial [Symbiodinium microadriaticum]